MKTLSVILLLASSSLQGAISFSLPNGATSLTFTNRSYKTSIKTRNIQWPKTLFTVTSTNGWTAVFSSSLITVCTNQGFCARISDQWSNTSAVGVGGTQTVALNWFPGSEMDMAVGTYSGTVTFTETGTGATATLPITVIQYDDTVFPTTIEAKATPAALPTCTTQLLPSGGSSFPSVCAIANEAPVSALPTVVQPAVGGTYDGGFGQTVTRLTAAGCATEYGSTTPFSALDTYIFTSCGIYTRETGVKFRDTSTYPTGLTILSGSMSPTADNIIYYYNGTQILKWDFVANTSAVLLGDYSLPPYNVQSISTGSTQPLSDDGWFAFSDGGDGNGGFNNGHTFANFYLCAVNLFRLETDRALGGTNSYCTTFTPLSGAPAIFQVDWLQTTEVDAVSKERYVYTSSNPFAGVFVVGPTGSGLLTQKYIMPEIQSTFSNNYDGLYQSGESFVSAAAFTHGTICKGPTGEILYGTNTTDAITGWAYHSFYKLSAGRSIMYPEEQGGGATMAGLSNYDAQPGCSSALGAWGMVPNPDFNRWYSTMGTPTVSGANVTFTPTVTVNTWVANTRYTSGGLLIDSNNHFQRVLGAGEIQSPSTQPVWNTSGGITTDASGNAWRDLGTTAPFLIANATAPWTCLNGLWTASGTSLGVFSVPAGSACVGQTGGINATALIGYAGADINSGIYGETSQAEMWRPGKQVIQVAFHRGVSWNTTAAQAGGGLLPIIQYNTQLRGGPSKSGCYMHWNSNMGSLDLVAGGNTSVYWVPTGLCKGAVISNLTAMAGETTGMVSYTVTGAVACSIEVSAGSSFSSVLRTITDAGTMASRNTSLGALSAATNYFVRVTCGQRVETATLRTQAAGGAATKTVTIAAGTPNIPGATQLSVGYRLPGGSFTFTSNLACTNGCSASFPGTMGEINEYQYLWKNAGGTTLVTSPSGFLKVPR